jgi:hypothetical protein
MLSNTLTLKLYVVKEKVWNYTKSIERISNKQVLADPLTNSLLPSVFREHTVNMSLWESLCFPDKKGPKLKNLFHIRDVYCSC